MKDEDAEKIAEYIRSKQTTPLIHSDPAGEDTPTTILEGLKAVLDSGHTISPNSLAHADIVAVLKLSPPQTGRTYTEGDSGEFAIQFLEWYETISPFAYDHLKGTFVYMDHFYTSQEIVEYFKQYLKEQNSKP